MGRVEEKKIILKIAIMIQFFKMNEFCRHFYRFGILLIDILVSVALEEELL